MTGSLCHQRWHTLLLGDTSLGMLSGWTGHTGETLDLSVDFSGTYSLRTRLMHGWAPRIPRCTAGESHASKGRPAVQPRGLTWQDAFRHLCALHMTLLATQLGACYYRRVRLFFYSCTAQSWLCHGCRWAQDIAGVLMVPPLEVAIPTDPAQAATEGQGSAAAIRRMAQASTVLEKLCGCT